LSKLADEERSTSGDYHSDLISEIILWEDEHAIHRFSYKNIPVWRLIRTEYIRRYLVNNNARTSNNFNQQTAKEYLAFFLNSVLSILQILKLSSRANLILGFPRKQKYKGRWIDSFFDPLMDWMGRENALYFDKPFNARHYIDRSNGKVVNFEIVRLAGGIGKIVFRIKSLLGKSELGDSREVELIASRFGKTKQEVVDDILATYHGFLYEYRLAKYILNVVNPRNLLFVNRWVNFSFIAAARDLGVRPIELQHGAVGKHSFQYLTKYDTRVDPVYFLAFGEFWKNFDWGIPDENVVPIGHRYIGLRRGQPGQGTGKAVMLTSKPPRWRELDRIYSQVVKENPDTQFILKLHPQDVQGWENRYKVGLACNVHVIDDPTQDLYEIFSSCQAVIGDDSTLLYEASFFGLKVGLLNEDGNNPCEAIRYVGSYNFFEIKAVADVKEMLASKRFGEVDEGNPFFSEFKGDLLRNMLFEG